MIAQRNRNCRALLLIFVFFCCLLWPVKNSIASQEIVRKCVDRVHDDFALFSKLQKERLESIGFNPETATKLEKMKEVNLMLKELLATIDMERYRICPGMLLDRTTKLMKEASIYNAVLERSIGVYQRIEDGESVPEEELAAAELEVNKEHGRWSKCYDSFQWELDFDRMVNKRMDEKTLQKSK